MAWRLVCESEKMPTHGSSFYVFNATWRAASSALVIVWVSSWPDASIIYVGGGVGGEVYYCCSYSKLTFFKGAVCIDPLFGIM